MPEKPREYRRLGAFERLSDAVDMIDALRAEFGADFLIERVTEHNAPRVWIVLRKSHGRTADDISQIVQFMRRARDGMMDDA